MRLLRVLAPLLLVVAVAGAAAGGLRLPTLSVLALAAILFLAERAGESAVNPWYVRRLRRVLVPVVARAFTDKVGIGERMDWSEEDQLAGGASSA